MADRLFFQCSTQKLNVEDCPGGFFLKHNYRMDKVLGHGMSGSVVLAVKRKDAKDKKAVKTFKRGDRRQKRVFVNEIGILQMVNHPHVISGIEVSTYI